VRLEKVVVGEGGKWLIGTQSDMGKRVARTAHVLLSHNRTSKGRESESHGEKGFPPLQGVVRRKGSV